MLSFSVSPTLAIRSTFLQSVSSLTFFLITTLSSGRSKVCFTMLIGVIEVRVKVLLSVIVTKRVQLLVQRCVVVSCTFLHGLVHPCGYSDLRDDVASDVALPSSRRMLLFCSFIPVFLPQCGSKVMSPAAVRIQKDVAVAL